MKVVTARNELESYCYSVRNCCDDQKMETSIKAEDRERVSKLSKDTLQWIDENPNAEIEEYEAKRSALEQEWKPIISAAYGSQQPHGAAQQSHGDESADHSGPKIDEVD